MTVREPQNLTLECTCPNCERRIFRAKDQNRSKRRYSAPRWFRQMFKMTAGTYPLGVYRIVKCEVCNKKLAIFDNNRGVFSGDVIVLYACSLLGVPLEPYEGATCEEQTSCYSCPLKKGPEYVSKR